MNTQPENRTTPTVSNPWRQAALGAAVVSGIFTLIVFGMLAVNYVRAAIVDPLQSERLEILKLKLTDNPNDAQLVESIRLLDVEVRRNSIERPQFTRRAAVLLLIGAAAFLVSFKIYQSLNASFTLPEKETTDAAVTQIIHAHIARAAIVAAVILLCGISLFYITGAPASDTASEADLPPFPAPEEIAANWHRFRGPAGAGISAYTNIPDRWNESDGENILWKSPVELPGYNSPIVWDQSIFLSGADADNRQVYCYELNTGELKWTGQVPTGAPQNVKVMQDTGLAAPTMTTDGRRVYAIFASGDLAAFDFTGRLVWHKFLGVPESAYGYATSLLTYEDRLVVQYDQSTPDENKSRLLIVDSASGTIAREIPRPVANTWTTPIIVPVTDRPLLITCAEPMTIAYDVRDWTEVWRAGGIGADAAASPVYAGGFIFSLSPYEILQAIDPTGTGDVTETKIAWTTYEGLPDICSPLSDGKHLWLLQTYGTLTCLDVPAGQVVYQQDLGTSFQASPSLVGDKIFLIGAEGESIIIAAAGEYKELARNTLSEGGFASPAFVDGKMILRTKGHIYCISGGQ